ncbi:MAG: biotin synthase BioB [Planctomycetota bacterium]|jgi:biotin synthase
MFEWLLARVNQEEPLNRAEAMAVLEADCATLPTVLAASATARRKRFGDKVLLCSILNAKSGGCPEDCTFCAQSLHHSTHIETHPLVSPERMRAAYEDACALPIGHFGMVTSGKALGEAEVDTICGAVKEQAPSPVAWCASLGSLSEQLLSRLRDAGFSRYHHNLETAESFFPNICTTHTYADRMATVMAARRVGLEVCSGGLFGLGESREHRVELAFALREAEVDAIPLNFLVPIPNTPLAGARPLSPAEILKTVAMFRLVCRRAELKVCAGREVHLGVHEEAIFAAGATGMMIGGYLTVRGRAVADDLAMIQEAKMKL